MEAISYRKLKERQRAKRDDYLPNLALRVHRASSWLIPRGECCVSGGGLDE